MTERKARIVLRDTTASPMLGTVPLALRGQAQRLGRFIRERRVALGFTKQVEFAAIAGVKQPQLSDWERGRYVPDRENLDALAAALQLTRDDLIDVIKGRDLPRHEGGDKYVPSRKEGASVPAKAQARLLEKRNAELERTVSALASQLGDVIALAHQIIERAKVPGRRA